MSFGYNRGYKTIILCARTHTNEVLHFSCIVHRTFEWPSNDCIYTKLAATSSIWNITLAGHVQKFTPKRAIACLNLFSFRKCELSEKEMKGKKCETKQKYDTQMICTGWLHRLKIIFGWTDYLMETLRLSRQTRSI